MRNSDPLKIESEGLKERASAVAMVEIPDSDGAHPSPERLPLESTGCYATADPENEAIHVFAKDGSELYGVSSKVIPFESKPLFLTLQIYMMGHNNGRASLQQEVKLKLEKISEFIKICI
jgi:hypothetical protein